MNGVNPTKGVKYEKQSEQNNYTRVRNIQKRGYEEESPKQGLTGTKVLTLMLLEGRDQGSL